MDTSSNPFGWSFSLGTFLGARIRVSWILPVLIVLLPLRFGVAMGLAIGGILFFSILYHEYAHVLVCRWTGGSASEILMGPFGGLAYVRTASGVGPEFLTAAAGPASNFILCTITLPWVISNDMLGPATHLVQLPFNELQGNIAESLAILVFALNWKLGLLNLVPAVPLDGGRMLVALLSTRLDRATTSLYAYRVSMVASILVVVGGLFTDSTLLVTIGFVVLLFGMMEELQRRYGGEFEDSFLGYDFSQGYTSLERNESAEPRLGYLARRKQRREEERREREARELAEAESQVDLLLDKVHREGMDALTQQEQRTLRQASERLRSKKSG